MYSLGYVYLVYGGNVSTAVDLLSTNGTAQLAQAALALLALFPYSSTVYYTPVTANITTTGTSALCEEGSVVTTTLSLYSVSGNIGSITVIDSSRFTLSGVGDVVTNLTWSSPDIDLSTTSTTSAVATECSSQGLCDRSIGVCNCLTYASSSNGEGQAGTRGDCGYLKPTLNCVTLYAGKSGIDVCSGRGICDSSTGTCNCQKGWSGYDCSIGSCPQVSVTLSVYYILYNIFIVLANFDILTYTSYIYLTDNYIHVYMYTCLIYRALLGTLTPLPPPWPGQK